MKIDSITHLTPDGRWFSTQFNASENRLLREMDENNIDRSVVVALAGYIENSFVQSVCERHPDRLIPCASFNPAKYNTPLEAVQSIKRLLSRHTFPILKLHPRLNKYDLLDHRCLSILGEVAKNKHRPAIWVDTFLRYFGGKNQKPPIDSLQHIVGEFSPLHFVLLHGCGPEILSLAEAIRDCPNTSVDISFTINRYRGSSVDLDLKFLFNNFDKKLLCGSDFPEYSIGETLAAFNCLANDLSLEKRENILGNNLKKLLDL